MTAYEATQEILNAIPLRVWEILDSMGAADKLEEDVRAVIVRSIEDCAKVADKYQQEEKTEADKFRLRRQPIQQATHAVMSVISGRIGKDIRALTEQKEEVKCNER